MQAIIIKRHKIEEKEVIDPIKDIEITKYNELIIYFENEENKVDIKKITINGYTEILIR